MKFPTGYYIIHEIIITVSKYLPSISIIIQVRFESVRALFKLLKPNIKPIRHKKDRKKKVEQLSDQEAKMEAALVEAQANQLQKNGTGNFLVLELKE